MKSAGVTEPVLYAFKYMFLRRAVARKSLDKLAVDFGLYITVKSEKDGDDHKRTTSHGDRSGFPVPLGLTSCGHYIHLYKTEFNYFSISHYSKVCE
jgi:hypothetical protein